MRITKEFLVEGAVYSLEQCGLLLSDAVALVDQKSYSSALVLAAFAREELGRSRILINFFDKTVNINQAPTLKDINNTCKEHVVKQQWAQLSVSFHFTNRSPMGQLMQSRIQLIQSGQTQSEDYKKLDTQFTDILNKKRKRTPNERHKARTLALYVEPEQGGLRWNIPKNTSPEFARDFIFEASNDYSAQRQIVETSLRLNPEFSKELLKWKERPELPLPRWPILYN